MGAFSPDAGCTIPTNLVSYWNLDETSGSRADSFGSETLTDNNTVTGATGKVSGAAQFTAANSEYLSHADDAALSTGDIDFTFAYWLYMDSKSAEMHTISKSGVLNREYDLVYDPGSDRFYWQVSSTGISFDGQVQASSFGAPSTGTWCFFVHWHDSVNNVIGIQVNNGTVDTTSFSAGVNDGTSAFHIGAEVAAPAQRYWDGRIDEVGFWKKVLSAQEKTDLYNSGNGNTYNPSGTCVLAAQHRMFALFD